MNELDVPLTKTILVIISETIFQLRHLLRSAKATKKHLRNEQSVLSNEKPSPHAEITTLHAVSAFQCFLIKTISDM